ncbi:MAG: acetyl-CoA C-acyltransferase, partial [Deltaproteobacteria bacterium]
MLDAWIYDGLRTPFGRHAGALARVRADDLVAGVMRALLARSPWRPEALEDVLVGCTNQAGEDSRNVARHAALLAGFPPSVPAQTVNRLCASGLAAVVDAARAITAGEGELYLAGGVESMSRAPFAMAKAEVAFARDVRVFDTTLGARFPNPRMAAAYGSDTMPETGDNVAREQGISRAEADRFAARSQERAERARATGFLEGEIVPVEVPGPAKGTTVVRADEHPRPATTVEALARLSPLFAGGVVTAGNASGVNDGAAALVVGSRAAGEKAGVRPLARILSSAAVGVEPRVMGIGPALAIPKALARAGLGLDRMDVIEVNEAFASQ